MNLLDLPEEILIIIIKHLDIVSLSNLYEACFRVRNIIASYGLVKKCDMTLSVLSTGRTLKLNFFKDISRNLLDLNLSGIHDLCKSTFVSAMKTMKSLRTLNVAYTNINILDLLEVNAFCPSIKNIAINFLFDRTKKIKLPLNVLVQCQDMFRNFENVHFVGNLSNLVYSQVALFILRKAQLQKLQFTILNSEMSVYESIDCDEMVKFSHFCLNFLSKRNTCVSYGCLSEMTLFSIMNFQNYEVIIIIEANFQIFALYTTPIFKKFFADNFDLDADDVGDYNVPLKGNISVLIWDKSSTNFDESFFKLLRQNLQSSFPCYFTSSKAPVRPNRKWYYAVLQEERGEEVFYFGFKRRRVVNTLSLDFDEEFQNEKSFQLSLVFDGPFRHAINLPTRSEYLKKITYLYLSGAVRYCSDFFNILFRCCDKITTLIVEAPSVDLCYASLSRSMPLSRTIKNVRLVDRRINFSTIFSSFSQCKTLENINIVELSFEPMNMPDPSVLIQNCNNLHCLYIYVPGTDKSRTKNLNILNKAKMMFQKWHLNIKILCNTKAYSDPYEDVFQLNSIKLLHMY